MGAARAFRRGLGGNRSGPLGREGRQAGSGGARSGPSASVTLIDPTDLGRVLQLLGEDQAEDEHGNCRVCEYLGRGADQ